MLEKKATFQIKEYSVEEKVKKLHEELAYIGRYMDGIAPTLARYKELEARKQELRQELKKFPRMELPPKKSKKVKAHGVKTGVNTLSNGIYHHYHKS